MANFNTMRKRVLRELVEATLIIGARRANDSLNHDSAKRVIRQHIKGLTERFDQVYQNQLSHVQKHSNHGKANE